MVSSMTSDDDERDERHLTARPATNLHKLYLSSTNIS